MTTYIAILRRINVAGKNLIKMDSLRKSFEKLECQNVITYIQSGNIIFKHSNKEVDALKVKITQQIEIDFGFKVPALVLTEEQLHLVITKNPFLKNTKHDIGFLHVTFLASKPNKIETQSLEEKKSAGEEIYISDNAVYLYCPNGYGKTKLTNGLFETKLKVIATTRNWKTATILLSLAQSIN